MTERPQQSYSAGESVKIPCRFVDAFVRGPDASAIRSMAATGRAEIRAEDGSGKLVVSGTEEAVREKYMYVVMMRIRATSFTSASHATST